MIRILLTKHVTHLCWLILFITHVSLARAAVLSTPAPNQMSSAFLWQGVQPFGAEKNSPSDQLSQGINEIGLFLYSMDAWRHNYYLPHEEQPLWRQMREDIQEQDVQEFIQHQASYKTNQQQTTTLKFQGKWLNTFTPLPSQFDFSIPTATGQTYSAALNNEALSAGEMNAQVTFSEGSLQAQNMLMNFDLNISLGQLLFSEALASIEATNKLFEEDYLKGTRTQDHLKSIETVTDHPVKHLSEFEQSILANLTASIPTLMQTLLSITELQNLASLELGPNNTEVTRIRHQQFVDLNKLEQAFPDTYNDFEDFLTSLSFSTRVALSEDQIIGIFSYDADSQTFTAFFNLANGGFVLSDSEGRLLEKIIYPTQLQSLNYHVQTSAKVAMYGLEINIDNITINARYEARKEHVNATQDASLFMQMSETPNVDVQGALLYFIPYWLIDLLIPGTLETLIADAFEDVVTGNNDQGFVLNLRFIENQGQHTLNIQSDIEMPHNLAQAILKIEEPEITTQPRLYQTLRLALRADFAKVTKDFQNASLAEYYSNYIVNTSSLVDTEAVSSDLEQKLPPITLPEN